MEVMDAIRERRSVRSYRPDPIPPEVLGDVLEAARLAPSASNRQPWRFVVVTDPGKRASLTKATFEQDFVGEAPVIMAAVALEPKRVMSCQVEAYAVDLSIAIDHMTLAAASLGLGTCWIGAFDQDRARNVLGIPSQFKIVTIFPLGYPADEPEPKERKTLDQIVCYDTWT